MKSIFISSTFKDMQAERDILHQRVFPKLRRRLAAYGEDVQELDLRWGVDTSQLSEEESGKFVIEACIDSIDRCKPYMVVLLGSRYGWIPERKTVEDTGDDRILTWCGEEASITQMEILYGALSQEELDKCVFCFRNESFPDSVPEVLRPIYAAESPRHEEKLAKLKAEIRERDHAAVVDYEAAWDPDSQSAAGLEAFEEQVTEALWAMLSRDLGQAGGEVYPEEKILRDAKLTAERYLSTYVSREMDRQAGANAVLGRRGFWFSGEPGSGKSAMMAKIADSAQRAGAKVFLYFGGNEGCGSVDTFLSTLLYWLDGIDGKKTDRKYFEQREMKRFLLHDRLKQKRNFDWAVLVDGVDQMEEDMVQILCWMARGMIREEKETYWHGLAASSTADFAAQWERDLGASFNMRTLPPLTSMELNAVVQGHAARRGKKLDAAVMKCIREKKSARNPYYLSLLMQKLFMMDQRDFEQAEALAPGMEGLSRYMCRIIEDLPEDTGEATVSVLRSAAEKLAARMGNLPLGQGNVAEPVEVLELLAASRGGLPLEELAQVLKERGRTFPPMFLEQLFCYLYDSFGESERGVWDFKHRLIRENLVSSMGGEKYRQTCAALLAHYEGKPEEMDLCLYYAWQAEDVPAGLRCLTAGQKELKVLEAMLVTFQRMLAHGGEVYLTALAEATDPEQAQALLDLLRDVGETMLHWTEKIQPWFSRLAPGEDAPDALRLRYGLVEMTLRQWDLDTAPFEKAWRQVISAYLSLMSHDASFHITMYFQCAQVLNQARFHGLWKETAAVLKLLKTVSKSSGKFQNIAFADLEETCAWGELLAKGEEEKVPNDPAFRQSLKDFLEGLPSSVSGAKTRQWRSYLAGLLINAGQYSSGNGILKETLHTLEFGYTFSGGIENAYYYVRGLLDKSGALQAKYAVSYLRRAQEICRSMVESYSLTYWKYLLGLTEIRLWKALEKSEDQDHQWDAPKALDEAIRDMDKLVETVGADRMPEDIFLDILDQRYQRVMRRRKKSASWKYLEEQKADFQYMETQYAELDARSKNYQAFSDMCWGLVEEVRYFDQCNLEDELVPAANKLLKFAKALVQVKSPTMVWSGLGDLLELSEILCRRRYIKTAASLTDQAYEVLQKVDSAWVAQRKKQQEYYRRIVRFYLMKARLALRQKDGAETGIAYIKQAAEVLDGKEGVRDPLPASDNTLRSEMWILFGELFLQAEKDGSVPEILDRTDRFWPEETCKAVLNGSSHGDRIALLRYCRGLALRARLRQEPKYMDKAVKYLRHLAAFHVKDGDASVWEELYNALLDACKYYWALERDELLPAGLMSALMPALAKKAEAGSLNELEQVLCGYIALEHQSNEPRYGLGGRTVPEIAWLKLVFEQQKAQEQPNGQTRTAARLAMGLALRGDYAGAVEAASGAVPGANTYAVLLARLVGEAARAVETEKAPEEPLTPQALSCLETALKVREPFVCLYLEAFCRLADSYGAGPDQLENARRAMTLLQERMEALGKNARQTAIPAWIFSLARLLAAAKEAGADLGPEAYMQVLRAGDDAGRELYDSLLEPEKKDAVLTQVCALDLKLANAYQIAGQTAKSNNYVQNVMRQTIQLKKNMTPGDWREMLALYERLTACRDALTNPEDFRQSKWLELQFCGGKIFQGLYQTEKDPAWMERQAAEAARFRERLLEVEQESLSWRQEKAADAWEYDREAWLTLLRDRPTERQWLARYLEAVQSQIEALGEGSEKSLEALLDELYGVETVTPEEAAAVNRTIDLATAGQRECDSDLMYLMFQALRDLGEEAPMDQVQAYIEMRRAGGKSTAVE